MPEDHSEAAASWSMDSLEITDAFGRIVPISLRYNTGFMDAAVRASVRDRVTFFWRFEDDPLMGAGGPAPEMEAGLAEMEAAIIAAIPGVGMALIQYDVTTGIYAVIGYALINLIFSNIVEPRVMGKGMGISALVVFLSLIFWGWVLGPVGMILSVPLTMILKILLEGTEDLRWIAVILGSGDGTLKEAGPTGS